MWTVRLSLLRERFNVIVDALTWTYWFRIITEWLLNWRQTLRTWDNICCYYYSYANSELWLMLLLEITKNLSSINKFIRERKRLNQVINKMTFDRILNFYRQDDIVPTVEINHSQHRTFKLLLLPSGGLSSKAINKCLQTSWIEHNNNWS